MVSFRYTRAINVSEALSSAALVAESEFIAGGTNLLDLMKINVLRPIHLVDVNRLPLKAITPTAEGGLRLGALATNAQTAYDERVARQGCRVTAAEQAPKPRGLFASSRSASQESPVIWPQRFQDSDGKKRGGSRVGTGNKGKYEMILRPLTNSSENTSDSDVKSASEVFIQTEKHVEPPCVIFFQAAHSKLAGDIARHLKPEMFGKLPDEVIRAIAEHDFGWQESDQSQVDALPQRPPRAFPRLSTEETMPSWRASMEHARALGGLGYVMISRHFTLLGRSDPGRAEFVQEENRRRDEVESRLPVPTNEIEAWTGAIGFADLLSLYLCCGSRHSVEFPMAHPANPTASHARKVNLSWSGEMPVFYPTMLEPGATVSVSGQAYRGPESGLTPVEFSWCFGEG